MRLDNNIQAFIAFLRAGLWEKDAQLSQFGEIDLKEVYSLAEEQSVVGLVAAGLDHVRDIKLPKEEVLAFVGTALQLEQMNKSMNGFIADVIEKMRGAGIYTLLLKGQGVAQCYEKPLWRACGDVDLFLSEDNYNKAAKFLYPLARRIDEENPYFQHIAMNIDNWEVELHGTLRNGLWPKLDSILDQVKSDVFLGGNVRSWTAGYTQVFLLRSDEDVVYVFSHILQHFFQEGIGLRQICDWCRLLWHFRDKLNYKLLENRIKKAGIGSEWRAFAALAVEYLGMPEAVMPFYSHKKKWSQKAQRIMSFILETGNFGHNRDYSYYEKYPFLVYKVISLWRHISDTFRYMTIFPLDSIKVMWSKLKMGMLVAVKGK